MMVAAMRAPHRLDRLALSCHHGMRPRRRRSRGQNLSTPVSWRARVLMRRTQAQLSTLILVLAVLAIPAPRALAATCGGDFGSFIAAFKREAAAQNISA